MILSCQPLSRSTPRHLEPQQVSPAVPENQEGKKKFKIYRWHNAHVDGGNCLTVITEKCLPGPRRRFATPYHVFRHRQLSDFEPEHQQLTVNPGRTPQRVFATHPPDQVTQAPIDFRPLSLLLDLNRSTTNSQRVNRITAIVQNDASMALRYILSALLLIAGLRMVLA